MTLATGQILNHRYRITKLLAIGGFGATYQALDSNLGSPCVIKENLEASPEAQRQFIRDAHILSRLSHLNLPRVTDHFIVAGKRRRPGSAYLVTDFVEGENLQALMQQAGGPLDEVQALEWVEQVCTALSYLHSQSPPVIHGDIKPANIIITPENKAMLVDFGISKRYDIAKQTKAGGRAVTSGFSSVEQYGKIGRIDTRSDVFSLGATLYALLAGQAPLEAPERNLGKRLPAPSAFNSSISPGVEAVILKAMEMVPDQRFQSVTEMCSALRWSGGFYNPSPMESISLPTQGETTTVPPQVRPPQVRRRTSSSKAKAKTSRTCLYWVWVGLMAVLAVAVLLGAILWGMSSLPSSATQTAWMAAALETLQTTSLPATSPPETPLPSYTGTPPVTPTPMLTQLPARFTDANGHAMALVPAGEFQIGYPADFIVPAGAGSNAAALSHRVYVDAFYMDIYEVTNLAFAKFMNSMGNHNEGGSTWFDAAGVYSPIHKSGKTWKADVGAENHSVREVSWYGAQAYCAWRGVRLPSEAEWEHAARGGLEGKQYPWGDQQPICLPGSQNGAQFKDCGGQTLPAGSFAPNGFGLYDMAGNVWEWVMDWYAANYYSESPYSNPTGPDSGRMRVMRGGSWDAYNIALNVASRAMEDPAATDNRIGFRCVRTP